MSDESTHAHQVVQHFRELLGKDLVARIGEPHLSELELMIESAIDASNLALIHQATEIAAKAHHDIERLIQD